MLRATPYSQCPPALQLVVAEALLAEWPQDFAMQNAVTPDGVRQVFLKNYDTWKATKSALFVFTDADAQRGAAPFVGTVSVEYSLTATYAPCIANVYVYPTLRRFGFGGVLMTFAERFLKRQAMSAAYLWCDPELVRYYEKRSYKVVDVPTGGYKEVRFMGKSL
jgi:GNAT superfamily N-acetyltransferase